MTKEEIYEAVSEKFPNTVLEGGFEVIMNRISEMDAEVRAEFEAYLMTGSLPDYTLEGYSADRLMREYDMSEMAAFFTLDWIKKDPKQALKRLKKHDALPDIL